MHYLDKINPNLMVICTANHLESLNPDIIKRFTCKIEREMTFLDVKNMMKRLLLKDNGKKIESVNGDNLYKMIMEENKG